MARAEPGLTEWAPYAVDFAGDAAMIREVAPRSAGRKAGSHVPDR